MSPDQLRQDLAHLHTRTACEARDAAAANKQAHEAAVKAQAVAVEARDRNAAAECMTKALTAAGNLYDLAAAVVAAHLDGMSAERQGQLAFHALVEARKHTPAIEDSLYAFYVARCKEQGIRPDSNPCDRTVFGMFSRVFAEPLLKRDDKLDAAKYDLLAKETPSTGFDIPKPVPSPYIVDRAAAVAPENRTPSPVSLCAPCMCGAVLLGIGVSQTKPDETGVVHGRDACRMGTMQERGVKCDGVEDKAEYVTDLRAIQEKAKALPAGPCKCGECGLAEGEPWKGIVERGSMVVIRHGRQRCGNAH